MDLYVLYYIEVGYLYDNFLESFYQKWLLHFLESFLCPYWDDHMIFVFHSVNMVYHIDWLAYVEESLHPWSKPHWSCCVILLMYWIFTRALLSIFASMFIYDIDLQFSFYVLYFSGFDMRVMVALWNKFGSFPPSAIFGTVWAGLVLALL